MPLQNFYYEQEDILLAEAERQGFNWSVHRPHTIGDALGNVTNMGVTLAVYGSACQATGEPFVFPGSPQQYGGVTDKEREGSVWASPADDARWKELLHEAFLSFETRVGGPGESLAMVSVWRTLPALLGPDSDFSWRPVRALYAS